MILERSADPSLRRMFHRSVRYNYSGAFTLMLNTVVDGLIISHFLGSRSAAAFGYVIPLYSLMSLFKALLSNSAQTRLGADLGRGDLKAARHAVFVLLVCGAAASLPLMLLFTMFRRTALVVLYAGRLPSAQLLSEAADYMLWVAPSMLPLMILPVLHPVMQLDGDIRRSPLAIHVATAVNICGDLLSVLVFHRGLEGVALATTLSCFAELLVLTLHYRRESASLFPAYCHAAGFRTGSLFAKGLPFLLRESAALFTGVMLNRLVFRLGGEDAVAVLAIGNTLWSFLLPASIAVCGTCVTLGSVVVGEEDRHALHSVFRLGVWYAFIPCALLAALFFAAAKPLALFCAGDRAQITDMTVSCLRCLFVSLPFTVFCQVSSGTMTVLGKGRQAVAVNTLDGGLAVLPVSLLLGKMCGIGGVWYGRPLGAMIAVLAAVLFSTSTFRWRKDGPAEMDRLERSLRSEEEAVAFSEELRQYCLRRGFDRRVSNAAALCAEELACNTLQWGFASGKNGGLDLCVCCKNGRLSLRFRDFGRPFDPERYAKQFAVSAPDPSKNVGLRIVSGMASDMRYTNIADCNIVQIRI